MASGNDSATGGGRRLLGWLSRWPLTAAVAAGIFGLSSIPQNDLPEVGISHIDIAAHVIEFSVLAALLFRSVRYHLFSRPVLSAIIAVLCTAAYGVLDEWHQSFTGRCADPVDAATDVVAAVLGVAAVAILNRWRRRNAS